jgi:Glucose inhibited division protein A
VFPGNTVPHHGSEPEGGAAESCDSRLHGFHRVTHSLPGPGGEFHSEGGTTVQLTGGEFDVIVIGSGRSGRETALAATREGCSTLLISLSPGTIASMMWSTSASTPLKQELIQAFIPSGDENGKNKNQPTVTIQTTLHQPDRESSVYVLQAQVQRNPHDVSASGGSPSVLRIGQSSPDSSGPNQSLREREMRIREKLIRRNNHLPEPEEKETATAAVKTEPDATVKRDMSSVYQQRNTYLRKKLLDRSNGREIPAHTPPEPRRKEEATETTKKDSAKASSPILFPTSKDARGLPESLIHMDRPRRKKQRPDGAAKIRPLIHRETAAHEKKPSKNRFQALVWEDSKGVKSTTARKGTESKGQTKAVKFAESGTEEKESMEDGGLPSPPPDPERAERNSTEVRSKPAGPDRRNEQGPASSRSGNRPADSEPERDKKRISFIEREQARMILEQSSSTPLKREAIQLEDPYGYNAWEDIMPFSRGKENKTALDASEKRKIALRGLRNLINNLG